MNITDEGFSNRVLWWGISILFAYISLVPFYYLSSVFVQIPGTAIKFSLFKYTPSIIILGLFVLLIKQIFKTGLFRFSYVDIAIYLFVGTTLFSGIGLSYYHVSLAKALYYFITGVLLYFLITSINLDMNKVIKFLKYIVIVASLVAGYGIFTFIWGKDLLFDKIYSQNLLSTQTLHFKMGRILSSLGHPDFLGSYLAILSPIFLFRTHYSQTKYKKFIAWVLYLIVMAAILLTFSGGAYLAFIFANSILVLFIRKQSSQPINKLYLFSLLLPTIILGIFFIIIMLTVIPGNQAMSNYILKILNTLFCGKVKFEELLNLKPLAMRIDSLKLTWSILKTNPIAGIGIGNISSGGYVSNRLAMDNMYLSIISESGLIGISAFLFMNFMILKKLLSYYERIIIEEHKLIIITLVMCLLVFLVDSLYWDTIYHPTIRMIYWIIMAISIIMIRNPSGIINSSLLRDG